MVVFQLLLSLFFFLQLFRNGLKCLLEMVLLLISVQESCCHMDFGTGFGLRFCWLKVLHFCSCFGTLLANFHGYLKVVLMGDSS